MRIDLLLEHLDTLVTTPEDAVQLEGAILQLAVQGKLVPQDPDDEPATEVLEHIRAGKKELIAANEVRGFKDLPPIEADEIPYQIPDNWVWCRLPDIYRDWGQSKPVEEFTYIDVSSIDNELGVIGDDLLVISPEDAPSRARKLVERGSVIYSTVRPYLLNVAIVDRAFDPPPVVSTAFEVMHPLEGVLNKYLYYYLRSQPFIDFVELQMVGMAYPAISKSRLHRGLFPLPPLAEQKRIVAKVESLLAQTRALAARLEQADAALVPTAQAAFQALLDAPDAAAQRAAWQRVAEHFDTLTGDPRAIETLKQTILQLAVQGKLAPQDPDDEPASVLVERIKAGKERLAQEGKIGKSKLSSPLKGSETPCELPRSWVWVRLDQLLAGIQAGRSPTAQKRPASREEQGVLKVSAVSWGEFLPNENKALLPGTPMDNVPSVRAGDFLISRANTAQLVGAVVLVRQSYPNLFLSDKTLRLDFVSDEVSKPYLLYALRASWVRQVFEDTATGTSRSMQNISQVKIRSAPIALPPLAEQKRIVAKVESLLALCDELAARVAGAEEVRGRLLRAVLNGE